MIRMAVWAVLAAAAVAPEAWAGDSSEAWGTGTGKSAVSSIVLNKTAGDYAQTVELGRNLKNRYYSNYSCGVCVTYTIDGHGNEISGNTTDSTNSGTVTSNSSFGRNGELVSTTSQTNE